MGLEATYPLPPRGLATSFTESELPLEYSARFRNRFINGAGGAEKRQGIVQLGDAVAGGPSLDALHELIKKDGTSVLFASGDAAIYKWSETSAWTEVFTGTTADNLTDARIQSVQMDERLIFVNGTNRAFYTVDGSAFAELKAIVEMGVVQSAGTSANGLVDPEIVDWIAGTDVVINDIVFYPTLNGFGLITTVGTAGLQHTAVSAAAIGAGNASGTPAVGHRYEIIDMVELNIVTSGGQSDNVAIAGSGTDTTHIRVVDVADFTATEIRKLDFVYNSTRVAIGRVGSIASSHIRLRAADAITGQTSGDSLVFLKSAMPIASYAHVHYGRLYLVDARDKTKVRISGANDPTDFTTDAGTLDSTSFNFGGLQPRGDTIQGLASYQNFFILGGKQNVYAYSGTQPIPSSAAANDVDFTPVGLFPQGCLASRGLLSIGHDLLFVTHDGVQAVSQVQDATTLNRSNISEAIRKTLRSALDAIDHDDEQIELTHYPQRSWVLLKVGSELYCYNYAEFVGEGLGDNYQSGSWSLFTGPFARQNDFFVRQNGDLLTCGDGGKVYRFDTGSYADDGEAIYTEFQTGWLSLEEPRRTVRTKQLQYIKPLFEAGAPITYTVRAEAPFDAESTDSVQIQASGGATPIGLAIIGEAVIGGSPVANIKHPLRVRGEVMRLTITTESTAGPDILGRFTLYANVRGRQ